MQSAVDMLLRDDVAFRTEVTHTSRESQSTDIHEFHIRRRTML